MADVQHLCMQAMFYETNSKRQSEYNEEAVRAIEELSNQLSHITMQLSLNTRLESDAKHQAESHAVELKQSQDQANRNPRSPCLSFPQCIHSCPALCPIWVNFVVDRIMTGASLASAGCSTSRRLEKHGPEIAVSKNRGLQSMR